MRPAKTSTSRLQSVTSWGPVKGRRRGRGAGWTPGAAPQPAGRAVCREARPLHRGQPGAPTSQHPGGGRREPSRGFSLPPDQTGHSHTNVCREGRGWTQSRPPPFLCAREPRGPGRSVTHPARAPVGGAWRFQPDSGLPARWSRKSTSQCQVPARVRGQGPACPQVQEGSRDEPNGGLSGGHPGATRRSGRRDRPEGAPHPCGGPLFVRGSTPLSG